MHHFVQYHNPDVMGRPYKPSHKDFGIVTDKFFRSLFGATVWLVTNEERPRRYYLCSSFIVDKVDVTTPGSFVLA